MPFALGTTLGGSFTGAVAAVLAGLMSPIPRPLRYALAAAAILALVALDLATRRLPLPQRRQLIPQEVFHDGLRLGLFRFGVEYGTGARTLIPSAAPYVVLVALLAANLPWWQTVLIGVAFGGGRALASLALVLSGRRLGVLTATPRLLERAATAASAACVLAAWLISTAPPPP